MAPAAAYCPVKERLLKDFADAVADYNALQTKELEAILKGGDFSSELEIAGARERRYRAKYAILAHRELHGC